MLGSFKHRAGKKGKDEAQIAQYKTLLEQDPDNLNARLKLGDLYAKLYDTTSAIQEYTTAAIRYAEDGYIVKAIAVNKIIVRLDPSRKEALDRLSDLYFQRGVVADPLVQSYRKEMQQHEPEEEPEAPAAAFDRGKEIDSTGDESDTLSEFDDCWSQIPLLATLSPENQQWLHKHALVRTFEAETPITHQDDEFDSLIVLLVGKIKLFTKDKEGQDTLLDSLEPGEFFGGTSLFAPLRQNQVSEDDSFMALSDGGSTILEIPKSILAALVKRESAFSDALLEEYYKRKTSGVVLARVPLFSYLDPNERRKIVEHLIPTNVRKGATIIREGEMGDAMYVIKAGQVGVYTTLMEDDEVRVIKTDQERLHLATLQDGDFFGEQALITHEPRSATIIALSDVQLLKFTQPDLAVVVKQYPHIGKLLKKYHQQRISDTLESLKSIW
ncbi:hypothetical protein CSA56_04565 [candidate division KSB3 bacterium]|uniref:Cyclic nucleotide-binding domain-containing protein n=1 Tax=candidate division KSB3 bacterium TaxID=2044937 RepID=A0A2G6KJY4_9BACT|nr:MAG: hypothetical protein CSA56_04565 [candidate division KSB3 bacterium]